MSIKTNEYKRFPIVFALRHLYKTTRCSLFIGQTYSILANEAPAAAWERPSSHFVSNISGVYRPSILLFLELLPLIGQWDLPL